MSRKNNRIDVDRLFDIVAHMKSYNDNKISYEKLLENNPSHRARELYNECEEGYLRALNDFDYFVQNYVTYKEKEEN